MAGKHAIPFALSLAVLDTISARGVAAERRSVGVFSWKSCLVGGDEERTTAEEWTAPAPSDVVRSAAAVRNVLLLFLGRSARDLAEVKRLADRPIADVVREILTEPEFAASIELPLACWGAVPGDRFAGQPTRRLSEWARSHLPMAARTRESIGTLDDWRPLLRALWNDGVFQAAIAEYGVPLARSTRIVAALDLRSGPDLTLARSARMSIAGRAELDLIAEDADLASVRTSSELVADGLSLVNAERDGSAFRGTASDPQLIVNRALQPGLHRLELALNLTDDAGRPIPAEEAQLFLCFEGAFREHEAFTFAVRDGRVRVHGLLHLRDSVDGLRLDPSNEPCRFLIERFVLDPLRYEAVQSCA